MMCSESIQSGSTFGRCDPVFHFLFRGTDRTGTRLISYFESFLNYPHAEKRAFYDEIIEISKNEDYMKKSIEDMNIPQDILLRIESAKKLTSGL